MTAMICIVTNTMDNSYFPIVLKEGVQGIQREGFTKFVGKYIRNVERWTYDKAVAAVYTDALTDWLQTIGYDVIYMNLNVTLKWNGRNPNPRTIHFIETTKLLKLPVISAMTEQTVEAGAERLAEA